MLADRGDRGPDQGSGRVTNRTRELFEFAQLEPEAIYDMRSMLRDLDNEEVDHVEMVAHSLIAGVALLAEPESEFAEQI